jgi:O-antigen/teichoic acid export membrane protein
VTRSGIVRELFESYDRDNYSPTRRQFRPIQPGRSRGAPQLSGNDALPGIHTPAEASRASSRFQFLQRALPRRARLTPVAYTFADQALAVGGGFLVNVALARAQSKEEYGLFALSYSAYALLLALYQAAILEPYMVYGSGRYRERFSEYLRLMIRSNAIIGLSLTALLLLSCFFLSWVAPAFLSRAYWGLALTAGVIMSSHLLRRAFYLQRRPELATKTSFVFFIVVACGVWLATKSGRLDSFTVFLILALGWTTAGAALGRKLALGRPERSFLQIEPHYWRAHWNYSKWVLATAIVFQFTTQGYYWLVAAFLSAREVGELRAIYLLISPMDQVFIALSFLVLPALSTRYARKDVRSFLSLWKRYVWGTLAITGTFAVALRILGKPVIHVLYAGKYDGLLPFLFILALLPVLMGVAATMNNAVIATEKPKLTFFAYVCGGATTFLGGIPLVMHFGLWGAIYGMLLSGTMYTGALAVAFALRIRGRGAPAHFPEPEGVR